MIALLAMLLAAPSPDATKLIAVLEVRNMLPPQEQKSVESAYFSDAVRGAIVEFAPGLRVMTRENVLVLLGAAGKSLDDCEGECEVDTGRRLGAEYVVSGEIYRIGTSLRLTLRLHETQSGTLKVSAQAEGRDSAALDAGVRKAVEHLLSRIVTANQRVGRVSGANPVSLWTSMPGEFDISLLASNGGFGCEHPLTGGTPCRIEGVQPGIGRLVSRNAQFAVDLMLPKEGGSFRIAKRSWWPTAVGAAVFGLAAVYIPAAIAESTSQSYSFSQTGSSAVLQVTGCASLTNSYPPCSTLRTHVLVAGGVAMVALTTLIVDLALGHEWTVTPSPLAEK